MSTLSLLGLAIALAMDAFAVAVAVGIDLKTVSPRQTFRLSWHFGLFQALMPVIGWAAGTTIRNLVHAYDHWIAFALLAAIGLNMIREAFSEEEEEEHHRDATKGWTMVMLSVATSIDALAVGFSMSLLQISIVTPAIVIGVVAALFTITGMHLGRLLGASRKLSLYSESIGGLVLFAIGLHILYDHGVFSG